jgi:hypothetical protein
MLPSAPLGATLPDASLQLAADGLGEPRVGIRDHQLDAIEAPLLLLLFEKASPTCATSQMFFMSTDTTSSRMGVWPPGAGLQGQAPNHPMLLRLRAAVVSVGASLPRSGWGKGGLEPSGE